MRKTNSTLTAERARELFNYDPETGVLTRRVRIANKSKVGDVVGYASEDGYLRTEVGGFSCLVHRIIWLHYFGNWPEQILDHKDRNPANNRIENLQDISQTLNSQNRGASRCGSSAFKGVSWNSRDRRWAVRIRHSGKSLYLGYFTDEQEARSVYQAAAKIYHSNSNPANLKNA